MPLFGSLDIETVSGAAPTMTTLRPDTWRLPEARVLQVSYEVAEGPALAVTPPGLHPSIPPYATFSVISCPESPVGPFSLAMVRLIVRAGIRPRGLLMGAFADSAPAATALSEGWGYRIREADVGLTARHDRIEGSVVVDGTAGLMARLDDPEPIAGSDLELFDNLHLATVPDRGLQIVQIDPGYDYRSADRGRADLPIWEPAVLDIDGVQPQYRLIGVSCVADIELGPPRFMIDPLKPAVQGTTRLPAISEAAE